MTIESPKIENKAETNGEKEETFQRYLTGLDLSVEQLKDKKILDLGCGEEGEFVKKCIDDKITREIYGLDSTLNLGNIEEKYKENFLKGNFEGEFPIKDFDYIISMGAIEPALEETEKQDPQKTILSAIEALKDNGEIRIFPIRNASPDSGLKGIEESRKKWMEILENLSSQELIDYELKPMRTRISGNKPDTWTEEALIIKKKQMAEK